MTNRISRAIDLARIVAADYPAPGADDLAGSSGRILR
jgi:hypothetical protein